jgi:outer membrane lipoprotein-sorting protein
LEEDASLGARRVWVLDSVPEAEIAAAADGEAAEPDAAGDPTPDRIKAWVDQEFCLPLQLEFFDEAGQLRRRLRVDPEQVRQESEHWVPRQILVEDLEADSRIAVTVDEIEVDIQIAPAFFTVRALEGMAAC